MATQGCSHRLVALVPWKVRYAIPALVTMPTTKWRVRRLTRSSNGKVGLHRSVDGKATADASMNSCLEGGGEEGLGLLLAE